jgi:hypothetical protein
LIRDDRIIRARYLALALATIALGLAVHRGGGLDRDVRDFTGDALWGMMVLWWAGFLAPRSSIMARAVAALGFCVAVELSQLLSAPWLDSARATLPGQLVLGSGFDPRDLLAYAVGVGVGVLVERALMARV